MKIVTFNVNGVRARMDTLIEWLEDTNPEVVALQETKIQDLDFPSTTFENLGYECYLSGQKSFNGVAILTKGKAKLLSKALPGNNADQQARFIEVFFKKKRGLCVSIYQMEIQKIQKSLFISWNGWIG